MDSDHAMDDAPAQFAQQISAADYERQAVEYTTQQVAQLNAAVRAQPEIGTRSEFFQDEENVAKGLPVFQGTHTRFVYDEDEEIVAAVDVTQEALSHGPVVRTVAELDEDVDDEEEEEEEEEEYGEYEEDQDEAVHNTFYNADEQGSMAVDALMEDVEMEMAAVAIDEQKLLNMAAQRQ